MKKFINCFIVLVFVISSLKYYSKLFILQILKKMFDRKVCCLSKKAKISMSLYSFLFCT